MPLARLPFHEASFRLQMTKTRSSKKTSPLYGVRSPSRVQRRPYQLVPAHPNLRTSLVAITNADERRRYADAFRSAGYRASEATDGLSCLSALRSDLFDMLVIDQHLIWGSGDGVIEVMHHDPSMEQIPVVLLNFPSPNEPSELGPSGKRELRCDEIVYIVQRRLAGSV